MGKVGLPGEVTFRQIPGKREEAVTKCAGVNTGAVGRLWRGLACSRNHTKANVAVKEWTREGVGGRKNREAGNQGFGTPDLGQCRTESRKPGPGRRTSLPLWPLARPRAEGLGAVWVGEEKGINVTQEGGKAARTEKKLLYRFKTHWIKR